MNDQEYEFIQVNADREARSIIGTLLETQDIDKIDVLYDLHDPVFSVVLDTVDTVLPDNDIEAVDISDIVYPTCEAVYDEYREESLWLDPLDDDEEDDLW